jgi:PAS domain S-box-containing protein
MDDSRIWRIDLHCHSAFSDGTLVPEQLAQEIIAAECGHAALTDHNTTAGLERFRQALEAQGVRVTNGLELDAECAAGRIHLLAYGFDEHDHDLQRLLLALRHPHLGCLLPRLRRLLGSRVTRVRALAPGQGVVDSAEAIHLVHQAGGHVFLAHPLTVTQDLDQLAAIVRQLKQQGLDGIEACYKSYDRATRSSLVELAREQELLVCGGSDYHGPATGLGAASPGWEMQEEHWRPLNRLLDFSGENRLHAGPAPAARPLRSFLLQVGLPAMLAGILFLLTIFLVLLPTMKRQLLDQRKEMIQSLVHSAVTQLESASEDVADGLLTLEEAQLLSLRRLQAMTWGEEGTGYFWVIDGSPTMLMHPWRHDLVGQDLSTIRDPGGALIFVAMADALKRHDTAFFNYHWQLKDDADHVSPKLGVVEIHRPWGWIVGTGFYTEELDAQVAVIRDRILLVSLLISIAVGLLLVAVARQNFRLEKRRARAEKALRESSQKYRALASASGEGTLMLADGAITYASQALERMLGYTTGALAGKHFLELLADQHEETETLIGSGSEWTRELRLLHGDGGPVEMLISASPWQSVEGTGLVLTLRDLSRRKRWAESRRRSRVHYHQLTRSIPMGVFRSRWQDGRAPILEANPAMKSLLVLKQDLSPGEHDWLAQLTDPEQRETIIRRLEEQGSIEMEQVRLRTATGSRLEVRLHAVLVHEEDEMLCDGVMEDLTASLKLASEREELISQLQSSLFYLQEPIAPLVKPAPMLKASDTIHEAAARMNSEDASALVVISSEQEILGMITDRDFRARVTAEDKDRARPVREIMSAPVTTIEQDALVYEAVLRMQEKRIGHLVVVDDAGRLKGVIRDRNLIHFLHYSGVILGHSIQAAESISELGKALDRLPRLVSALIASGSRVRSINRIISRTADSIVERVLELAHRDLGPAPLPYAFVAMGSEGRREQTLLTDQDNGIVYQNPAAGQEQQAKEWFLAFGQRVSQDLARAGYHECRGGVMASRPEWNGSLDAWSGKFNSWIKLPEGQQRLSLNIAFDLRTVVGDTDLVRELRRRISESIEGNPGFLLHMAREAMDEQLPRIQMRRLRGGLNLQNEAVDLKAWLAPVVAFSRLYALRHQLEETHTLDRLSRLHEMGRLSDDSWEILLPDYESMMRLRLQRQSSAMLQGRDPSNLLAPGSISAHDEATLKRLQNLCSSLRSKVGYDFLGMA